MISSFAPASFISATALLSKQSVKSVIRRLFVANDCRNIFLMFHFQKKIPLLISSVHIPLTENMLKNTVLASLDQFLLLQTSAHPPLRIRYVSLSLLLSADSLHIFSVICLELSSGLYPSKIVFIFYFFRHS